MKRKYSEEKRERGRMDEHWVKGHKSHRNGKVVRVAGHWAENPTKKRGYRR